MLLLFKKFAWSAWKPFRVTVLDPDKMTWQEKWYYRVGLLTGFWGGTAVGLLMALAWYIFTKVCEV